MPEQKKKLEEILNSPKTKGAEIKEDVKLKGKSLDNIVAEVDKFSKIQESKLESKTNFFKKIFDIGAFASSIYLQLNLLPAKLVYTSMIPMFGFILSKKRSEQKQGKKFTWSKFFRTSYLGQIMGYADVAIFSLPGYLFKLAPTLFTTGKAFSFITGSSLLQKMLAGTATTLAFNPTMIPAYNSVYTAATYFRDKVGFGKALTRPHKIKRYFGHMYNTEIKGKWQEDTKNVFKYLFPLHWLQMTVHPNVYTRLAQSILINNKVYADQMEKQKLKKGDEDKSKTTLKDKYNTFKEKYLSPPYKTPEIAMNYA